MKVRLISHSQPSKDFFKETNIQDMTELIAFCARVSNPENQNNSETYNKLIKYLIKNAHWSPFELVGVCLEIETTRDIGRQILRHRSFSFNEYSQRYADPTQDLDFEVREARLQDNKNRQNSIETDDERLQRKWEMAQRRVIHEARAAYEWAIKEGIAKEVARVVLPEGNTVSRMYMNGTLRSWLHYIELRSANGTQKEHRDIALACAEVIGNVFPMAKEFATQQ